MNTKIDLQTDFINAKNIIIHGLGNPTRLKILQLINGDKIYRIKDINNKTSCTLSNTSQQISKLEDAGLVKKVRVKEGENSKYVKPVYSEITIKF